MVSRRKTLALIGGGTVVVAGAAVAGFVVTRTPNQALAPWDQAGDYVDSRKWALSYALLAPSAHNRQPWLIGLTGEDIVTLWRDRTRELPPDTTDAQRSSCLQSPLQQHSCSGYEKIRLEPDA